MSSEPETVARAKVRVTLDLTPQLYARLEVLEEDLGATSKSEVLRKALLLYEYLHGRLGDDWALLMEKDDQREQLIILSLMP